MGKGKSRPNTVGMAANGVRVVIDKDVRDPTDPVRRSHRVRSKRHAGILESTRSYRWSHDWRRWIQNWRPGDGWRIPIHHWPCKEPIQVENGKHVSPAPLEENPEPTSRASSSRWKGQEEHLLIVHPSLDALRSAASAAGVSVPSDNAAMCADEGVKSWLLANNETIWSHRSGRDTNCSSSSS